MTATSEDALADLQAEVERAEARATVLARLQVSCETLHGRSISRARDVVVDVDAQGQLVGLSIEDSALTRGGRKLAQEIRNLSVAAAQSVHAQRLQLCTELLGSNDPAVQLVAAEFSHSASGDVAEGGVRS